jgi:hypothetical protein
VHLVGIYSGIYHTRSAPPLQISSISSCLGTLYWNLAGSSARDNTSPSLASIGAYDTVDLDTAGKTPLPKG